MFLVPMLGLAGEQRGDDSVVHGTINIALGNQNGLVVLTDSMLTYANGKQSDQPGQKLFNWTTERYAPSRVAAGLALGF